MRSMNPLVLPKGDVHCERRKQGVSLLREGTLKFRNARQAAGFAGLLVLRALALTALRDVAGRMTVGRPAGLTAASPGSGSGLKCAWQAGESWDLLRTMQAVTRPISGISELLSRNAPIAP